MKRLEKLINKSKEYGEIINRIDQKNEVVLIATKRIIDDMIYKQFRRVSNGFGHKS